MNVLVRLFNEPFPIRKVCQVAIRKANIGSYSFRRSIGAVIRPNYAFLVYHAASLAARLGLPRISVLEFGCAGGMGLLALEYHAEQVEKLFPVKIDIYGFDTGEGIPVAKDYRDLLYVLKPGFYKMDIPALKAKLKRAKLVLGDVDYTVSGFFKDFAPAPIGAVAHDMDFYSSTVTGLKLFEADPSHFLPRVLCYFDDTTGSADELFGDYTGELLAIHKFNENHTKEKLSPLYWLRSYPAAPVWHHGVWSLHLFEHPDYNKFITGDNLQLPI
jgi:hypothetical protein